MMGRGRRREGEGKANGERCIERGRWRDGDEERG